MTLSLHILPDPLEASCLTPMWMTPGALSPDLPPHSAASWKSEVVSGTLLLKYLTLHEESFPELNSLLSVLPPPSHFSPFFLLCFSVYLH